MKESRAADQSTAAGNIVPVTKLADRAYEMLRRLIVGGELQPGQKLSERALAARLGISQTPVREALQRLERDWLIERPGPKTMMVARASRRRLRELRMLEAALRGVAAGLAAESATDDELNAMANLYEEAVRITRRPKKEGAARVLELNRKFHAQLDAASHNPVVVEMIATATAFDFVTRVTALQRIGPDYPREWVDDHGQILDALRHRDSERAEELMRSHILRTGRYLVATGDEDSKGE